jgi:hypothetical protein
MRGQQDIKFDTCLSLLLVQCQLIEGELDHSVSTKAVLNIMTSADDDSEVMERVYCINNRSKRTYT